MYKLLVISPSDIDDIRKKNTQHILETWDESFFGKVCFFFPFGKINHDEQNEVYRYLQLGWKTKSATLNRFRIVKLLRLIHLLGRIVLLPIRLKSDNYTMVRATDPYLSALVGLYFSKILKVPLVVSIHANYTKGAELGGNSFRLLGSRKLAIWLEGFIYHHCRLVLPIREHLKQDIITNFALPEENVRVFPHGISFSDFDATPQMNVFDIFAISKDKKIISFAGRFSQENYIDDIVLIAKKVIHKRNDVVFLLAGGGSEWERIKSKIEEYFQEGMIILPGFQNQSVVVNIRRQSFISLCLMGGYSLIEACAAAKPVIAYAVEWHDELVIDKETGFLIAENDIEDAVEKIIKLLDHPAKAEIMGINARDLAFSRHSLTHTSSIKRQIYREVLEVKPTGT